MALGIPTQFQYDKYVNLDASHLRAFLLDDSVGNFRWRGDSSDRIHGGARRTYLKSAHFVDRLLFSGNSKFHRIMSVCFQAADKLMSEIVETPWQGNRAVINKMPPGQDLSEHIDPVHFANGVVVIGIGEAGFIYKHGDHEVKLYNPGQSLMFVPPAVAHRVENGEEERISIVIAHDTQLAMGRTATGQYLRNLVS